MQQQAQLSLVLVDTTPFTVTLAMLQQHQKLMRASSLRLALSQKRHSLEEIKVSFR